MKVKMLQKMQADIETDRRVLAAKEKLVKALMPFGIRRARRIVAAAAILTGHGDLVGVPDKERKAR